jgi:serine/threonine protein kinase
MTPEQWRQVEALYDATVGHPPEERAALLANADSEVRRLTEALLAEQPTAVKTPDPATPSAQQAMTATRLSAGAQIGPYRIEGLLGTGGMATVYRATDTRLGRRVAINISDERFSGRFQREAQSIAALNHPHICTLYDIGPNYLVMELVEGETLSARLKRGPLPPPTASQHGAQIADALIAANSKEITHRDLKPGNVMVTKNGVKVLDFGLAKMKTGSEPLTESHVVIGTPLYMAPEQLEGKACDARTDLYALGLLLYECLTGKPLRQGQAPSWNGMADRLKHVVSRCLEHDPDDRWQTARDLRAELNWAQTTEARVTAPPKRSRVFSLGLAVALTIAVAGAIYWYTQRSPHPHRWRPTRRCISRWTWGPNSPPMRPPC